MEIMFNIFAFKRFVKLVSNIFIEKNKGKKERFNTIIP